MSTTANGALLTKSASCLLPGCGIRGLPTAASLFPESSLSVKAYEMLQAFTDHATCCVLERRYSIRAPAHISTWAPRARCPKSVLVFNGNCSPLPLMMLSLRQWGLWPCASSYRSDTMASSPRISALRARSPTRQCISSWTKKKRWRRASSSLGKGPRTIARKRLQCHLNTTTNLTSGRRSLQVLLSKRAFDRSLTHALCEF
jgi:hypothetical protein